MSLEIVIMYAFSYLGTPYIYGGNNYSGIDCSGFCNEIMKSAGLLKMNEDLSAQALFTRFSKEPDGARAITKEIGNLVFYGKSNKTISHCALMLSGDQIIEAAGGDEHTKTPEDAAKRNAYVRVRKVDYRPDYIGMVKPWYL